MAAAADRIESGGWASHYQQPGVTLSDAIALEARDAAGPNATRAALLTAAFAALKRHIGAACLSDCLGAHDRTQPEIVAGLRGAAGTTSEEWRVS
jgi:hypothetical protein